MVTGFSVDGCSSLDNKMKGLEKKKIERDGKGHQKQRDAFHKINGRNKRLKAQFQDAQKVSGNLSISLREIKKCGLTSTCQQLDIDIDIKDNADDIRKVII